MKEKKTSSLDQELADAVAETAHAEPGDAPRVERPLGAPQRPAQRSLGLLLTLLAMVVGVVCLFLFGIGQGAVYAMKVDEVVSARDKLAGKKVRVEGELV